MSRRSPRVTPFLIGALAALVVGCAAPTQLSFGAEPGGAGTPVPLEAVDVDTPAVPATSESVAGGELVGDVPGDVSGDVPGDVPADVEESLGGLIAGWVDCFHSPAECNPNPITADGSPERARLAEAAAYYAAESIRTKPDEGRLEWDVEAVSFTGSDRARVVACEYDTRVYFDSSMAETEIGDIIFDTTIWTRRVEWTLARESDTWKLWSRRIDRRSPVARFCTP